MLREFRETILETTWRNQTIPQFKKTPPVGTNLLDVVERSLDDDKAQDVVVIELSGKSAIADHLVVASGTSQRHVGAMAEHLREQLKKAGLKPVAVEGMPQCDWVLVDGGDVVVHLFRPEVRDFYNIEKMWGSTAPTAKEGSDVDAVTEIRV
jgi:ribosome-associated protein